MFKQEDSVILSPARIDTVTSLPERLQKLRDSLLTGLVERDVAIRLALIASLAGEHLLLLGPPGTAKSLVARRLHLAFQDSSYFERLLTRFTVPEELFGPLSIKGLEEDRYERLISSYLPTATIAFLDEIFKANSAILNALLTLLNEREFDNGPNRITTPLLAVIGASNELPSGDELDALFDRFLLRLHVGPVSKDAFPSLLGLRGHANPDVLDELKLTSADLAAVQEASEYIDVPADVIAILCDLRTWCTSESIQVSDRRWRKIVKLLQVSAYSNGKSSVSVWDCWLLQHCLWDSPSDREKVYSWYSDRVGASAAMDPKRLTRIVTSWEANLKADQESRSQMRDDKGQLLYKGKDGALTVNTKGIEQAKRGTSPLYLLPPDTFDQYGRPVASDRKNGGKGFTEQELNNFQYSDDNRGYYRQSFQNWSNRNSYLANKNNWLMTEIDLLPEMEPTRHKKVHIKECLREVLELKTEVESYKQKLLAHISSLENDIRNHLWVTSDFVEPATTSLNKTKGEVDNLLSRIMQLHKGFELLPCEMNAQKFVECTVTEGAIDKKDRVKKDTK